MDGILRISEKCSRPINRILSDTTSAFTDQPWLCCRKHRSLRHHLCFRAMINRQPRIRRPRCYSSGATGTPVDLTTDSKRHALLSARVRPLGELLCSPFPFLLDFDLRETFFGRPSSRVLFFGRLQYRSFPNDSNAVWPRENSVTTFKFFFVSLFLLRRYSRIPHALSLFRSLTLSFLSLFLSLSLSSILSLPSRGGYRDSARLLRESYWLKKWGATVYIFSGKRQKNREIATDWAVGLFGQNMGTDSCHSWTGWQRLAAYLKCQVSFSNALVQMH